MLQEPFTHHSARGGVDRRKISTYSSMRIEEFPFNTTSCSATLAEVSMSNPENPPPEPPNGGQSPDRKRQGDAKRPDRPQMTNVFWYLMFGLIIVAIVFSVVQKQPKTAQKAKG